MKGFVDGADILDAVPRHEHRTRKEGIQNWLIPLLPRSSRKLNCVGDGKVLRLEYQEIELTEYQEGRRLGRPTNLIREGYSVSGLLPTSDETEDLAACDCSFMQATVKLRCDK